MFDVFIESLMLPSYLGGLPYTTNLGEMLRAKISESSSPRTKQSLSSFEKRWWRRARRATETDKRPRRDCKVWHSNGQWYSCELFPLFSEKKKKLSTMDCEPPLCGTAGLWVVDKTAFWQPYSVPSSIINQREGEHFQEYSSSQEVLPEDITHEKILQLLVHLKHSASQSPSVGILCLHAHTSVWLFPPL